MRLTYPKNEMFFIKISRSVARFFRAGEKTPRFASKKYFSNLPFFYEKLMNYFNNKINIILIKNDSKKTKRIIIIIKEKIKNPMEN